MNLIPVLILETQFSGRNILGDQKLKQNHVQIKISQNNLCRRQFKKQCLQYVLKVVFVLKN